MACSGNYSSQMRRDICQDAIHANRRNAQTKKRTNLPDASPRRQQSVAGRMKRDGCMDHFDICIWKCTRTTDGLHVASGVLELCEHYSC